MKRIIGLFLLLTLCVSLACPAFAAENDFVPSITYKGKPEIVPVEKQEAAQTGGIVIGVVREISQSNEEPGAEGKILSYIEEACLLLTSVAEAETSEAIPQKEKEILLEVYQELSSGRMKLPYEKVEGYNGESMVIRELLDGTWLCGGNGFDHDHPTEVRPDGIVFELTFDLGVKPEDKVVVMTYHDGEWEPIVDVKNNGDGTILCVFEHLCPIAISVAQDTGLAKPAGAINALPWMVVMVASLAGIVAMFLVYRKKQKK